MTYLADQFKGGMDPLQNHSRHSGDTLQTRQTRYAVRIVDIDPATGASVVDPAATGDVLCATNWQPSTRPIGGWAHAWPVVGGSPVSSVGASSSTSDAGAFVRAAQRQGGVLAAGGTSGIGAAGANAGAGNPANFIVHDPFGGTRIVYAPRAWGAPSQMKDYQSRITLNASTSFAISQRYPAAKVRNWAMPRGSIGDLGPGSSGGGGMGGAAGPAGTGGAAGPGGSYGASGPRANRVITGEGADAPTIAFFQPVQDSSGAADDAFAQASQFLPPGYPALVPESYGTWLGGTEHRGEEPFYLHGDPRLVAVNNGPDPRAGSVVFDTRADDGGYDLRRNAKMQSAWRVMPQPVSNTLDTGNGGTLALQLMRSERDGTWGYGSMVDLSSPTAAVAAPTITPGAATSSTSPAASAPMQLPVGTAALAGWNGTLSRLGATAAAAALQAAIYANASRPAAAVAAPGNPASASNIQARQRAEAIPTQTLGLFSARVGGPLEVGHGSKDKHRVGDSGDAAVNVGHLATHAPFFADPTRDGPLAFEQPFYPYDVKHFPLKSEVHVQFDPVAPPTSYAMQRTLGKGAPRGVWRLWAEVPEMQEGGYPPVPPPTTPPEPPDPPWPPPPTPPRPPPPTTVTEPPVRRFQTQQRPPRGFGGAAPGGWAADGSGPQPVSYAGGGTAMGVVDRQPSRNRQPTRGVVDLPTGSPLDPPAPVSTAVSNAQRLTLGLRPDEVTSFPLALGVTATLWRPHDLRNGRPDILASAAFPGAVVESELARRPFVLRQEAWGAATGQGFTLNQRPGASRYANGTGAGGLLFLPPEIGMKDVDAGSTPFTTSTAYVAAYPGVYFGAGIPILTTGGLKTGYRWGVASGALGFDQLDSAGTAITVFGGNASAQFRVREGGGTLLTFSGTLADGEYLKRSGATLVGGTPTSSSSDVFSAIVAKTANYTIVSPTDNGTTFDCDSSGGAFTMTLPTAPSTGFRVAIMRRAGTSAALTVTVQAGGADVIRGPRSTAGTSFALQLYESVVLTYYATPGVWLAAAHSSTADAGTSIASLRTLGTGSLQACAGSDSRLSDNRIPTDASVSEAKLTDAVWTAIYFGI